MAISRVVLRRTAPIALFGALAVAGCGASHAQTATVSAAQVRQQLAGSPAPLAALHGQANRLLSGGTAAFSARLRALRGYPVVVNKWASWCGPCQSEFGFFAKVSAKEGKRVAFLGVDSDDTAGNAASFLRGHPVSYPSYSDHDQRIADSMNASYGMPQTIFIDRHGTIVFDHAGAYPSAATLARDVHRYGLGGA
jgi:thiol-disulfide isomerase/thioredoxin